MAQRQSTYGFGARVAVRVIQPGRQSLTKLRSISLDHGAKSGGGPITHIFILVGGEHDERLDRHLVFMRQ